MTTTVKNQCIVAVAECESSLQMGQVAAREEVEARRA